MTACQSWGLKRRPLLRTSSPLKSIINLEPHHQQSSPSHANSTPYLNWFHETCFGEICCRRSTRGLPAAGTATLFSRTICFASSSCPYRFLSAPLSERKVEPSSAFLIHHQQPEVGSLTSDLETNTATFQSKHRWCAPRSPEVLPGSADYHSTSIACSHNKPRLFHRWKNNLPIPPSRIGDHKMRPNFRMARDGVPPNLNELHKLS